MADAVVPAAASVLQLNAAIGDVTAEPAPVIPAQDRR
jgi:hypothetical protein